MICIGRLSYGRCRNGAKLDVTLSKAPDLEPPSPRMGKTHAMSWVGLVSWDVWGQHNQKGKDGEDWWEFWAFKRGYTEISERLWSFSDGVLDWFTISDARIPKTATGRGARTALPPCPTATHQRHSDGRKGPCVFCECWGVICGMKVIQLVAFTSMVCIRIGFQSLGPTIVTSSNLWNWEAALQVNEIIESTYCIWVFKETYMIWDATLLSL